MHILKMTLTGATLSVSAFMSGSAPVGAAAPVASLCSAAETVVFECPLGAKRVAICATTAGNGQAATAQYRYGRRGAVELRLPQIASDGPQQISYSRTAYSGGGEMHLQIENNGFDYTVYERNIRTGFGADGNDMKMTSGLIVRQGNRVVRKSTCKGFGAYGINSQAAETFKQSHFQTLGF
jgi:hypothetical protein